MKLHFRKGEGSGSDLQVAVSGWENKVMGTERDEKLLILIRSHLFIFAFISNILGGGS